MFNLFLVCTSLFTIAMAEPISSQEPAPRSQALERAIKIPGTDYDLVLGSAEFRQPGSPSARTLLAAIETWLATQFGLPGIHVHPRIEFAPAAKIFGLRFRSFLSGKGTEIAANAQMDVSTQHETVALYYDATQTIYLPDTWTGCTPAELSVLVHEMVHHFQNLHALKHECPQAREELAYIAQDRWLGLFGRDLASDFELDPFSLLVKTKCFY